jgi:hypothetical protein
VLYCDNFPGKIKIHLCLHAQFLYSALPSIRKILLKLLLLGLTYKEADTVHSTIASFIKTRTAWAPSQWLLVITFTRVNPMAFIVKQLAFYDSENWPAIQNSLLPIYK